jgi:phage shock protein A
MALMDRVSRLIASDIDGLIEQAEKPEAAIEGLVGDIEGSIVALRREMVTAIARQNRLRKQLFEAEESAGAIERKASLALCCGEELRARHLLGRGMATLKARDALEAELADAGRSSARLVAALIRIEDRAQLVRRAHDGLLRRRGRDAGAGGERPRLVHTGCAFDGYTEAVTTLER